MAETKDNTPDSTGASKDSSKKSFAQFLAESGIQPIAFLGKCMRFFGMKATISFFLGAASFYGYGLFKHIPGINIKEKEIELYGTVQTLDGEPLDEEFKIGVLEVEKSEFGPFQPKDGTFHVPTLLNQRNQYRVLVLTKGYQILMLCPALDAKEVDGKYQLAEAIRVPTHLGRVGGQILDQDHRPVEGYVDVGGVGFQKIGSDGSYSIRDIPLGKVKIQVKKNPNDTRVIKGEDLQLSLDGITSKDMIVPTKK